MKNTIAMAVAVICFSACASNQSPQGVESAGGSPAGASATPERKKVCRYQKSESAGSRMERVCRYVDAG